MRAYHAHVCYNESKCKEPDCRWHKRIMRQKEVVSGAYDT